MKFSVLLDLNVMLDVIFEREPFAANAANLVAYCEEHRVPLWLSAHSVTTLHYLVEKSLGTARAAHALDATLTLCRVATVNHQVLLTAASLAWSDYEDAVTHQAALAAGCNVIASRNVADFVGATVPVLAPLELLSAIVEKGR